MVAASLDMSALHSLESECVFPLGSSGDCKLRAALPAETAPIPQTARTPVSPRDPATPVLMSIMLSVLESAFLSCPQHPCG